MKTKRKYIYVIGLLLCSQFGLGQFYHVQYNNTDRTTQGKLTQIIALITARNALITSTNAALNSAITSQTGQLARQYTSNPFDSKNSALASSAAGIALSLGKNVLSKYPGLPYMTEEKEGQMEKSSTGATSLLATQVVNSFKIKAGKRQEIYRLRRELSRILSKNDRNTRKLLLFSAGALVATNPELALELASLLKNLEFLDLEFQLAHQLLSNDIF